MPSQNLTSIRSDRTDLQKDHLHIFLRSRRSIHRFKSDPIPKEVIHRILETTICAPSAHNLQPWRFVILTGKETKIRMAEAIVEKFRKDLIMDGVPENDIQARMNRSLQQTVDAPVIIVLCLDRKMVKSQPDAIRERAEKLMGVQSVALSGLQLLLAAHAEELGGTWLCWPLFAPEEISDALDLDHDWEPQGMILLGFPAEAPEMPVRKPLNEIAIFL
jgi:coenzyme F420-0:L-glutamate ligase / coenzyme F420-1:gamma-L-glutamate ligase